MVLTSPVRVTTPAFTLASTPFRFASCFRRLSTLLAICLSSALTALRSLGATTCSSFFTLLTPSIPCVISAAAVLASAESTFPRSMTVPLCVSTWTWVPFTRSSAKRAILVFDVIQVSLIPVFICWVVLLGFSAGVPCAYADVPPAIRAAAIARPVTTLVVCPMTSLPPSECWCRLVFWCVAPVFAPRLLEHQGRNERATSDLQALYAYLPRVRLAESAKKF